MVMSLLELASAALGFLAVLVLAVSVLSRLDLRGYYERRAGGRPGEGERRASETVMYSVRNDVSRPDSEEANALRAAEGRLLYQIPPEMKAREVTMAEVRIGDEQMRGLLSNFVGDAPVQEEQIRYVEKMAVRLTGEPGAFDISELSERVQLIGRATNASGEFQAQQFGRWVFEVTPKKLGRRTIYVTVSGEVTGSKSSALRALPPRTFEVRVRVSAKIVFSGAALQLWALLGVIFAGFVGAATQDLWWPSVRETIEVWGWVNAPPAEH